MSRTDAHAPLPIRVARGDVARAEVHDHSDGVCDLPGPFDVDAWRRGAPHCHWEFRWDGHGVCPCWICHGSHFAHRENSAERQRTRRELRALAARWNANDELDGW